jgi:hypothetical protein
VPFTITVAPGSELPSVASEIFPDTCISCANAWKAKVKVTNSSRILKEIKFFFIDLTFMLLNNWLIIG